MRLPFEQPFLFYAVRIVFLNPPPHRIGVYSLGGARGYLDTKIIARKVYNITYLTKKSNQPLCTIL